MYKREEKYKKSPLADRMRPKSLDEFVGQKHILDLDKVIRQAIEKDQLPSLILWGPPGCGKTTLAHIVAQRTHANFISISAVLSGIKEVKEILKKAENEKRDNRRETILFIDEIHRFNKSQQDAFLHHIEDGTIILIGATTQNPSFQIISALLSRTTVLVFNELAPNEIQRIIKVAFSDSTRGLGSENLKINEDALSFICQSCHGDARYALNTLELCLNLFSSKSSKIVRTISLSMVKQAMQRKSIPYDMDGEEHYNVISAFIKSMRGSDPDAAIYWLARMLEAGEDTMFIARRMIIFASEDIGNADPVALQIATAAKDAFHFVGMPEGWIPLAQAATYLASSPKSNASYQAYLKAKEDVTQYGYLPVPLHLRNAPTKLMKNLGYGHNYKYPHNGKDAFVVEHYLPNRLKGKHYYVPSNQGYEKSIRQHLEKIWQIKFK